MKLIFVLAMCIKLVAMCISHDESRGTARLISRYVYLSCIKTAPECSLCVHLYILPRGLGDTERGEIANKTASGIFDLPINVPWEGIHERL